MPGVEGLGVPLGADPASRLVALAMPGDREQCLDAGMDDYANKPLGLKAPHTTIIQWINRTRVG
ncbi:hypothetical protein [Thiocystis violacea]|uniref:hypothetical protein n=1 Tax=Thiocystis violacea TaxID=13725 RepID=UPI0019079785|nr:hypothetical protein [Thiocystis violacea]